MVGTSHDREHERGGKKKKTKPKFDNNKKKQNKKPSPGAWSHCRRSFFPVNAAAVGAKHGGARPAAEWEAGAAARLLLEGWRGVGARVRMHLRRVNKTQHTTRSASMYIRATGGR